MIKKLLFFGLLSCVTHHLDGVIATGDTPGALTTFQFSVGSALYDPAHQQLWTISGQPIPSPTYSATVQSYGLAYTPFIPIDGSLNAPLIAYPYLPSQSLVSTTDAQGNVTIPDNFVSNPLLGQQLQSITFVGDFLTLVSAATLNSIYLIQSVKFTDEVYGKESPVGLSIMNQLNLGAGQQINTVATTQTSSLFIAQNFGTDSAAFSFATAKQDGFAIINDVSTNFTVLALQASVPITPATAVLTAGGADVTLGSSVTFYPSPVIFNQMYVGVDVTANAQTNSVGVGAFIANANSETESTPASITLTPLVVSDSIIPKTYETPISTIAGNELVVRNITTQLTSTGLSYIITSRYDGIDQQSVYAMPMVTMATNSTNNGIVADFNVIAQTFKISGVSYRIQGFSQPLTDASQINIAGTDDVIARLQVGNGPVPLVAGQLIEQVVAQGDAVYITIQQPFAAGSTPGMFKSQAYFDAQGRIMGWTSWQRVAGTDDQMLFAIKNRTTDATMYVSGATSNCVQQTVWGNGADLQAFISKIQSVLPSSVGGVQGIFPFSASTTGFTNLQASPPSQVAMLVATGNNNVLVAQTGQLVNDTFQILTQTNDTSIILNADNGLNIGSVVTAAFGSDNGTNNWLFMGGDGGLAVLSQTDGSGFDTLPNDGAASFLIGSGQTCKTIGNFTFVKKIVYNDNFMYVMTQDGVYQFSPTSAQFTANNPSSLQAVHIVAATQLAANAYCTDMLVDNELILLGTTAGLYAINIQSGIPGVITPVTIPGGLGTVSRLQTVSNAINQEFYSSSNLYVLSIDFSVQQARLNRFTITNGQVQPIQDQLIQGVDAPLLIFNYMSNNIFIDGSLGFTTSYRIGSLPPAALYMEYSLQAGWSSSQVSLKGHTANLSIAAIITSLGLTGIAREYASGCLMLAADFGLLTDS